MEQWIQFVCLACHQTNLIPKSELTQHPHELTEAKRAVPETIRVYVVQCKFCGELNRLPVKL